VEKLVELIKQNGNLCHDLEWTIQGDGTFNEDVKSFEDCTGVQKVSLNNKKITSETLFKIMAAIKKMPSLKQNRKKRCGRFRLS
jgi:hypothetical protein